MRIKLLVAMAAIMIVTGLSALAVSGSSHNDAPLIAEDPTANNTDVYAFVSTEDGKSDYVTIIANYVPLVEPGDGPTYKRFSERVLYEIMVDVDGDAKEDITYQVKFRNKIINGNTFLYNTGVIGMPPDPSNPSSQYANLNVQQSYTLRKVMGDRRSGHGTTLLRNARVAPAHVGPVSTGSVAAYEALADAAVHTVGSSPDDMRVFVGPRDEGFYFDLMGAFDLLNIRDPGFDTFSGYNVYTIAIEVPKSEFADAGDTDNIIGVWASASRSKVTVLRVPDGHDDDNDDGDDDDGDGDDDGDDDDGDDRRHGRRSHVLSKKLVQVSRLGNPVVNEVLNPLVAKDLFNMTEPKDDDGNIADFIVNPGSSQSPFALVPLISGLTGCTPENGRIDLEAVFLTGINQAIADGLAAAVPSLAPFADEGGNFTGARRAEMLRLNFNVPPSVSPSPLGLIGGDPAGFPNGRRVGDDVVDVALIGAGGGILHVLGLIDCAASLGLSDNVDSNDVPYLTAFPYLGTPQQGYEHAHGHAASD